MATYVNDLRLKEISTGDESGTWGTSTNTNLELIGEALGYATQEVFGSDADATTTIADGASDPARAMYFKITSAGSLTATRTCTIAPNTVSRVMFIENATTGSQSIAISQGSGASVTILTGKTAVVYLDGAGSGAAVVDAMSGVDPGVTDTLTEVLVAGNTSGGTNIELSTTDKVQFRDAAIYINSSVDGQLDIVADTEIQIAATTIDIDGAINASGEIIAASLDISGNVDVDGTIETDALTINSIGGLGNVANDLAIYSTEAGHNGLRFHVDGILPTDNAGAIIDADADLGIETYRFKDLFLSGIASAGGIITPTAGTSNFVAGVNAGNSIESGGNYNVVVGDEAGTAITTGDQNVAIGFEALSTATTASRNTAVGLQALKVNTGDDNSAFGYGALILNTTGTYNTAVGRNAGGAVTTGVQNTLIGGLAGDAQTTASNNTAVGYSALTTNTTGTTNTAVGVSALAANTTADSNTAIGMYSLTANTTGTGNTGLGFNSLNDNTTASNNTGLGYNVLAVNTTGATNTAVGSQALAANTTASNNTAVGYQAGYSNTTGTWTTAFGVQAAYSTTTPNFNAAFGGQSLYSNTTGANNVAVGQNALFTSTTASNNTAVGYQALYDNTTGTSLVAVGYQALANNTANSNTAVGLSALFTNTTGSENTGIGTGVLYANTTGGSNSAVGYGALDSNTTGSNNTALGRDALTANTTGADNVAVGREALDANTTASNNVAVGSVALGANTTGASNTALGDGALAVNTTASNNTAVGASALIANTTGTENVAVGANALEAVTTGYENIGIGRGAGIGITTGIRNTFIGDDAGYLITGGNENTILGRFTGNNGGLNISTSSNNIVLSDGAGNPRLMITSSGNITTNPGNVASFSRQNTGVTIRVDDGGTLQCSRSGGTPLEINRIANDGTLVQFFQDDSNEGNISVSGSTVSYNGFAGRHESSGIPANTPKGTVVSTIDELDVYPTSSSKAGQPRLDHAKVQVSSSAGDACVYGVVDMFDDDEKVMLVSVGIGSVRVTGACSKGDLLESNGDGTAVVQSDDIIRSKTIGKVTIGNSTVAEKLVSCVLYCG